MTKAENDNNKIFAYKRCKLDATCLDELRKLLLQNGYPAGVINYNINDVLNRQQNLQGFLHRQNKT